MGDLLINISITLFILCFIVVIFNAFLDLLMDGSDILEFISGCAVLLMPVSVLLCLVGLIIKLWS